ncbi:hypothetical protein OH76DRAFT_1481680 [Lentinus brumalis]|uniref:Uncharacterized protein n=1 Tax=Lentinus brumalis TaxID=2498619 RepID=A0A371DFX9_9APHY|nr:hypothetical protein OH76DRAFT_1481680 [Polyporus brumalis]
MPALALSLVVVMLEVRTVLASSAVVLSMRPAVPRYADMSAGSRLAKDDQRV